MKKDLWILVANSSNARLFKKKGASLVQIKTFEHPESRLHNRDLVSDKPGRDFESVGMSRHALEPQHTPHEIEAITFAKQITSFLQAAKNNGEFDALYLAANPFMLGLIRQNMDAETTKFVEAELDRDFTQMNSEEIFTRFTFSYL